jgi:hypothetical protein
VTGNNQLACDRAPGRRWQVLPYAEDTELIVSMLQNLVGLFSQQYIDKVCGTEALTCSVHGR